MALTIALTRDDTIPRNIRSKMELDQLLNISNKFEFMMTQSNYTFEVSFTFNGSLKTKPSFVELHKAKLRQKRLNCCYRGCILVGNPCRYASETWYKPKNTTVFASGKDDYVFYTWVNDMLDILSVSANVSPRGKGDSIRSGMVRRY